MPKNTKKLLTKLYKYVKIYNCNPLSQGHKILRNQLPFLRISEYTNKGGAFKNVRNH